MAGRGVHFALTEDELGELLSRSTDEDRLEHLQEEIEETLFETAKDRVCETDKAWEGIADVLGATGLDAEAADLSVLGGERLYDGDDYVMTLRSVSEVERVAAFLDGFTEVSFRCAWEKRPFRAPSSPSGDFGYLWENLEDLRTFYRRAADRGLCVLFTVDR